MTIRYKDPHPTLSQGERASESAPGQGPGLNRYAVSGKSLIPDFILTFRIFFFLRWLTFS